MNSLDQESSVRFLLEYKTIMIHHFRSTIKILIWELLVKIFLSFGMAIILLLLYFFQTPLGTPDISHLRAEVFTLVLFAPLTALMFLKDLKLKVNYYRELSKKNSDTINIDEIFNFISTVYQKRSGMSFKLAKEIKTKKSNKFTIETISLQMKKYLKISVFFSLFFSFVFIMFILDDTILKIYAGVMGANVLIFELLQYMSAKPWLEIGHRVALWEIQLQTEETDTLLSDLHLLDKDFQQFSKESDGSSINEDVELNE